MTFAAIMFITCTLLRIITLLLYIYCVIIMIPSLSDMQRVSLHYYIIMNNLFLPTS